MITVLLDSNVYDKLQGDEDARRQLATLVKDGKVRVIAPRVVVDELAASPFGGIPDFFEVEEVPDGVAVAGIAKAGAVVVSKGETFSRHLGNSKKGKDAVIAETAVNQAKILVSEDSRCRERLRSIGNKTESYDFEQFKDWLRTA